MAMKKAEMEEHRERYHAVIAEARSALEQGDYRKAIELAVSSWEYIDGMMQYERRYEDAQFNSIEGIDIVLQYAPFLLDLQSIDTTESLLKLQRRVEKNTSANMGDRLTKARELVWDAYRMWDLLNRQAEVRQDDLRRLLGGHMDRWRSLAEAWDKMGLVGRIPEHGSYRLSILTRMNEEILAKCPSCGVVVKAAKSKLLVEQACPKCHGRVLFVLLLRKPSVVEKG